MAFTNDKFRLDGKVAIVTGAGGRGNSIGRAYAFGLANAGAAVVVADLNGDGATRVAEEITDAGGKALAVHVDITDRDSVAAMAEAAASAFGGIDILVNNAALMVEVVATPAMQSSMENLDRILKVNLHGALNCVQAVVPLMAKRGGGRIVNALSAGAFPAQSLYGVSKIALLGLTTTLAAELGSQNITVNAIAPGMTKSEAGLSLTPDDSPLVQALAGRTPIHLRGEPDELVGPLIMLVSDAGSWMTGQSINVDGGWVMRN